MNALVLHGPNLNLLGTREPAVYGSTTLADIERDLLQIASRSRLHASKLPEQSRSALIDRMQAARTEGTDFILINPAAYTHTSVALRDALAGVAIPFVEIHISNVYRREPFRHHSYFSELAEGVIVGLGAGIYAGAEVRPRRAGRAPLARQSGTAPQAPSTAKSFQETVPSWTCASSRR